ncbi:VOC family protein [Nocardioides sp.]|uniref:VOC family protein n=1 Tax=Nocardioides sp. TaxID=35761 RepID=UPI003D0FF8F6
MTFAPGAPCWIELFTPDTDAAASFYGALFGWDCTAASEEYGGYRNFLRDGAPIAGMMANDGSMGPNAWSVYLSSDDLGATLDKATSAGASVVAGPIEVTGLGHMAFVVDPAGAAVGVWQPLAHEGFATTGEDNSPAWFETLSKDYDAAVPFYRDVFSWDVHTMSDTADFRYSTFGADENAKAGIMDASGFLGDSPSRWQFYVAVADTDAVVAQAIAAGAALAQPVEDTPYGRLGALIDPAGVAFSIMGPNRG